MLASLTLHNFKSWRRLNIDFAPITLLYGSNSSGKSSIIQFLLMLKQTKDSTDYQVAIDLGGPKKLVDLGSYRDALHNHDDERNLLWTLKWLTAQPFSLKDASSQGTRTLASTTEVEIEVELNNVANRVYIDYMSYNVPNARFYIYRKEDKPKYQLETSNDLDFRFIRSIGRAWDLPEPTKAYSFPDRAQTYFQNSEFLSVFESLYVDQMDDILYLGPLREDPRREYTWTGAYPQDVGVRGERTIEAILAASERGERRNLRWKARLRTFQEIVALWLEELNLIHSFEVREISKGSGLYRVYVRRTSRSPETLITDVGFGVSQILPVIVLLYYAPEGSTILIEQPEIHLHPAVQAGLADLFISVSKTRGVQLIIESHSEHLLNRLTRRIAERETDFGEITQNDVAVFFAEHRLGRSVLNELRVNQYGGIENWPSDFFGDQMGEVVSREKAALRRKLRQ